MKEYYIVFCLISFDYSEFVFFFISFKFVCVCVCVCENDFSALGSVSENTFFIGECK